MDYLVAPERIETPAFLIRSYMPGDGPLLNAATNSSYAHLRTYMPWARENLAVEESEKQCRRFRGRYLLADDFTLGIFAPDGTRLLGGTGFHLRSGDLATGNAEIGMWLRADAAGKGLGTQVLLTMLGWGFSAWPWRRIIWRCDSRNIASARTAQKAGMRQEGLFRADAPDTDDKLRDTLFFALLRDEWTERNRQ